MGEDSPQKQRSANQSGTFVAYMGYEWTQPFRNGGHHNVFFKTDKGRYVTRWEAPGPTQLYENCAPLIPRTTC